MLGHNKRLERKLREQGGKRAWATVLESKKEWASTGGANVAPGQAGSITIHQKLRLRVEPDGEQPFESTVKQVFNDSYGWHIPQEGYSVRVIFDPDDHTKLVMDLDAMPVAPGLDRDEAAARREGAIDRQRIRQRAPGDSAQRAEQMRAIALDASLSPDEKRAKLMELSASMGAGPKTAFVAGHVVAANPVDAVDALTKLADLRDRGVLTQAEFEAQKSKILDAS
jgi:Short C-terminal domain